MIIIYTYCPCNKTNYREKKISRIQPGPLNNIITNTKWSQLTTKWYFYSGKQFGKIYQFFLSFNTMNLTDTIKNKLPRKFKSTCNEINSSDRHSDIRF